MIACVIALRVAIQFSADGVRTSSCAALAMVPTKLIGHVTIVYLVLLIAVCKLEMEQHCRWIVDGTLGLRGKGCTRMTAP